MSRDEIQKLLGGYATGTLTPEEQQVLFEAALDDQELFDALAREQALRDLLRDPSTRAQLLASLDERPLRWYERLVQGWRPLAAVAVMAGVGAIAVVAWRQSVRSSQPVLVAQVSPPPAANPVSTPDPEPARTPPPVDSQTPRPQTAVKQAQPAPPAAVAGTSNAPVDRLAKDGPGTNPASPEDLREEDRRTRAHVVEAPKRKDLARSDTETSPAVKAETAPAAPPPPPSRPTLASGFRDGATIGGVNGSLQPQAAAEPKAPLLGSTSGNAAGGTAGRVAGGGASGATGGNTAGGAIAGVIGGITGGVPHAVPPPPAPPKAEAQPSQSAQIQASPPPATPAQAKPSPTAAPAQPQQGQQGAQAPSFQSVQAQQAAARSQFGQARQAPSQGVANETVQVQASASSLDAVSTLDVRSLFYGVSSAASLSTPGGRGGAGGGGALRKKVAAEAEKASAGQAVAVNAIAANAKTGQAHLPNLGVRYSLLRQTPTGGLEQVDPDNVKAGDSLELELMPNDSGTLLVRGRGSDGMWRDVMSRGVVARQTYSTLLKSGDRELQVTLTRPKVALTGVALRDDKTPADVLRQSTTEPATYVVANPASQQLLFTITLIYK
jgi:hypothetical protein